jgi:hypothetical protein
MQVVVPSPLLRENKSSRKPVRKDAPGYEGGGQNWKMIAIRKEGALSGRPIL